MSEFDKGVIRGAWLMLAIYFPTTSLLWTTLWGIFSALVFALLGRAFSDKSWKYDRAHKEK